MEKNSYVLEKDTDVGIVEEKLQSMDITNSGDNSENVVKEKELASETKPDISKEESEIETSKEDGDTADITHDNTHAIESDEEESQNTQRPVHYVDEEKLKEIEETLTEDEKHVRREECLGLKNEGNAKFKQEEYEQAIEVYTQALNMCPLAYPKDRAVLYSNRSAAQMKLGELSVAIEDCSRSIELDPTYIKVLMRRAQMYETTDKLEEALEDYKRVVELDSSNGEAISACMRLPDQIKVRNEKLKEEMMGKLKDLANLVLRPFSLSTDNFKLQQDPSTGSYSVNFQQNNQK
jgi:tetratricopeptide (TPR) repeat protein